MSIICELAADRHRYTIKTLLGGGVRIAIDGKHVAEIKIGADGPVIVLGDHDIERGHLPLNRFDIPEDEDRNYRADACEIVTPG